MTNQHRELFASYHPDPYTAHSTVGLNALVVEMREHGVMPDALLSGTGLDEANLNAPNVMISPTRKLAIFRNVHRLAPVPDIGLRAGRRQRLTDFGILGFALASSDTLGDAVDFGMKHLRLMGPVLEKRFHVTGDCAVFTGADTLNIGEILPLATEFWLGSILSLFQHILHRPLRSHSLSLPYRAPDYAESYVASFGCPVEFDAPVMEWRFDATILDEACPGANPVTAQLYRDMCQQIQLPRLIESPLAREIRAVCVNSGGRFPSAEDIADRLRISIRTFHRRLAAEGQSYQAIIDDIRQALALEFLRNTQPCIDEIAERLGFSEASNFRKAFKKWTGHTPSHFREGSSD